MVVAIQETIDETITTVELLPQSCPSNAYRKDRNLYGCWCDVANQSGALTHATDEIEKRLGISLG